MNNEPEDNRILITLSISYRFLTSGSSILETKSLANFSMMGTIYGGNLAPSISSLIIFLMFVSSNEREPQTF